VRVLVTGATGFVGRWLSEELRANGHTPIAAPSSRELDITDAGAVSELVRSAAPDAIAHLAAVSYAGDATRDPEHALAVNAGGTAAVIDAAAAAGRVPVLVSGSSEVYGRPDAGPVPLREDHPLRPTQAYGRSKLEQEQVAIQRASEAAVPVVVTRSFNHTGPGQRTDFVAPALAKRVLLARDEGRTVVRVGNLDVDRDLGDVRDVARAYRMLLDGLVGGHVPSGTVVNVATGRAIAIRRVLALIAEIVGIDVTPEVDPELVRANDAPVIVGDPTRLRSLTGWSPLIPIERTLADLVADLESSSAS
jgi:GDP-4-dehydro-6-deoxy-D-mannose reductase